MSTDPRNPSSAPVDSSPELTTGNDMTDALRKGSWEKITVGAADGKEGDSNKELSLDELARRRQEERLDFAEAAKPALDENGKEIKGRKFVVLGDMISGGYRRSQVVHESRIRGPVDRLLTMNPPVLREAEKSEEDLEFVVLPEMRDTFGGASVQMENAALQERLQRAEKENEELRRKYENARSVDPKKGAKK